MIILLLRYFDLSVNLPTISTTTKNTILYVNNYLLNKLNCIYSINHHFMVYGNYKINELLNYVR